MGSVVVYALASAESAWSTKLNAPPRAGMVTTEPSPDDADAATSRACGWDACDAVAGSETDDVTADTGDGPALDDCALMGGNSARGAAVTEDGTDDDDADDADGWDGRLWREDIETDCACTGGVADVDAGEGRVEAGWDDAAGGSVGPLATCAEDAVERCAALEATAGAPVIEDT